MLIDLVDHPNRIRWSRMNLRYRGKGEERRENGLGGVFFTVEGDSFSIVIFFN